jgi:hypothetical protein
MKITWNAIWNTREGVWVTNLVPMVRVFLRIILTGNTNGSFSHNGFKSDIISESTNTSTSEDEDVWVIRRKPSNPDRNKPPTFFQMIFGLQN